MWSSADSFDKNVTSVDVAASSLLGIPNYCWIRTTDPVDTPLLPLLPQGFSSLASCDDNALAMHH